MCQPNGPRVRSLLSGSSTTAIDNTSSTYKDLCKGSSQFVSDHYLTF